MSIEVMKQALEALCLTNNEIVPDDIEKQREVAIEALRQAIEQAERAQPVAWRYNGNLHEFDPSDWAEGPVTPLYTAPPPRQPLTEEQISDLWDGHTVPVFGKTGINPIVFARAIEAAHGITGEIK